MRPEDALGAVARGAQLVVVGDPKQLGPTSFFDTVIERRGRDRGAGGALSAAEAARAGSAAERVGARAVGEHPPGGGAALSAADAALALPQPLSRADRVQQPRVLRRRARALPASGHRARGGRHQLPRGGRCASTRRASTRARPRRSSRPCAGTPPSSPSATLMVVTMNQPQRELVDTLVQNAEKDDPALAAFRERHQDDARALRREEPRERPGRRARRRSSSASPTGPTSAGSLAQHFGPINATGGERRLNVLFTRAKFRLDVFCSFDPTDAPRHARAARAGCACCATICASRRRRTSRRDGSPRASRSRTSRSRWRARCARTATTCTPQVGVAGYHLDLAVVDPEQPGRYLLAIECDGATYHSAKSARDRDRLRQEVLERLGWQVHRIWSTDWFRDPRGETSRVVRTDRVDAGLARVRGSSRAAQPPGHRERRGP